VYTTKHHFKDINKPADELFKFQNTTENDVISIISNLKGKSSKDAYAMSMKLLKDIKLSIVNPLTKTESVT